MNILKYGAIDIGSNAIRLLISTIIEREGLPPVFKKTSLVRVPVRLGEDVFKTQNISEENELRLIETMKAYNLLMKVHKVTNYRACATSAMREALNKQQVVNNIKQKSDITIDIIDGEEEAAIIASTDITDYIKEDKTYLYVDVGGGSTEFSVFANGIKKHTISFKLGTVRLLNDMVTNVLWKEVEQWIKEKTSDYENISIIGSGGNINSIFKQSGKAKGKSISYRYLNTYYKLIQRYSYEERVVQMDMNPDRADVIIHATRIYLSAMKWSKATKIYVPKIGVADGIIKDLYQKNTDGVYLS